MIYHNKSEGLQGLPEIAAWIAQHAREKIWLFQGEMGAGKTTLIKSICTHFDVEDEVNSPTYSLVNEYHTKDGRKIYHFDLYRIEEEEEALDMGIEEYLYSGELCLIEWPEKIRNLLPDGCATISIGLNANVRTFELNTAEHE